MMAAHAGNAWDKPLAELLGDLAQGPVPPVSVCGLALDSRRVRPGGLFLAAAGLQRHGLEFVAQARAAGAGAIAYEPDPRFAPPAGVAVAVPALARHCGLIAARFYDHPSAHVPVAGVTGTNGKTTTVHLISRAARQLHMACGHMGTLGFGLADPLTPSSLTTPSVVSVHKRLAWLREQGAQRVAMEVSSHALDQGRVDEVRFDTAVFTNLSRDHLDYHASLDDYGAAKRRLFHTDGLRHAVLNVDDPFVAGLLDALAPSVTVTATGKTANRIGRATHWLRPVAVTTHRDGLSVDIESDAGAATLHSPLLGAFNASNLLQALGVLLGWGADFEQAVAALGAVAPPSGRMETFTREGAPLVVVDFAHTPDALANAVAALRAHCAGRLVCVFGCGGDRDRGKRAPMAQAAAGADDVIVTDDNPRHEDPARIVADIVAGFPLAQTCRVLRDRRQAIEAAIAQSGSDDVVLIAGKGHEDYQIVGREKLPFDDRREARRALLARRSGGSL
jgi:UDP-N-acetylmuramoyl-L-alanyl-D-glutamate--2,6-diaminopimelate ligase